MCEPCSPVGPARRPSLVVAQPHAHRLLAARVARAPARPAWRWHARAAGSAPWRAGRAGRAKSWKVTIADTGFPGSPKTSASSRVPNQVGLPGRSETPQKRSSTPSSRRAPFTWSWGPTDTPPETITTSAASSARADRRRACPRRVSGTVSPAHELRPRRARPARRARSRSRSRSAPARAARRARPARRRSRAAPPAGAARSAARRGPPRRRPPARPAPSARAARQHDVAGAHVLAGAADVRSLRRLLHLDAAAVGSVRSTGITALAPSGTAAPVEMRIAVPGRTGCVRRVARRATRRPARAPPPARPPRRSRPSPTSRTEARRSRSSRPRPAPVRRRGEPHRSGRAAARLEHEPAGLLDGDQSPRRASCQRGAVGHSARSDRSRFPSGSAVRGRIVKPPGRPVYELIAAMTPAEVPIARLDRAESSPRPAGPAHRARHADEIASCRRAHRARAPGADHRLLGVAGSHAAGSRARRAGAPCAERAMRSWLRRPSSRWSALRATLPPPEERGSARLRERARPTRPRAGRGRARAECPPARS